MGTIAGDIQRSNAQQKEVQDAIASHERETEQQQALVRAQTETATAQTAVTEPDLSDRHPTTPPVVSGGASDQTSESKKLAY